jgi:peptide/nickel transport system permease protein
MISFVLRRALTMAVTLLIISALVFFIIKLPPGDYLSNQIAELRAQGEAAAAAKAQFLINQYGLDRPVWEQYLVWIGVMPGPNGFSGLIQGDWGWSFEFDKPVKDVVGDALWLTMLVNFAVVIFIHLVAIPDRDLFATRQYSFGDYTADPHRVSGACDPSFLLALVLLYYVEPLVWGLHRRPVRSAIFRPALDLAQDPVAPLAPRGADPRDRPVRHRAMIRRMRANLLDELGKQYFVTAKAKGLPPQRRPPQVPVPDVAQPLHLGYRQPAAEPGLGLRAGLFVLSCLRRAILLAALKSQTSSWRVHLMFVAAHRRRHAGSRPAPRLARSRASGWAAR